MKTKLKVSVLFFLTALFFGPLKAKADTLNFQIVGHPWDAEKIAYCGEFYDASGHTVDVLWALNKEHKGSRALYINRRSGADEGWAYVRDVPASVQQITCASTRLWLWDTSNGNILYMEGASTYGYYTTTPGWPNSSTDFHNSGLSLSPIAYRDFTIQGFIPGRSYDILYAVSQNGQISRKQMVVGSSYELLRVYNISLETLITGAENELFKYDLLEGTFSSHPLGDKSSSWTEYYDFIAPAVFLLDFKLGKTHVVGSGFRAYGIDYQGTLYKSADL